MCRILEKMGYGCAILILFVLAVNDADAEWKEYAISKGAFAISMPTAPVIENHVIETETGQIDTHIVLAKTGSSVAYAVVYCEYPQDALFCRAPEKYLNTASDQMVRKMNGTLISETDIRLDGFPGREIRMRVPNGILHLKLYAVGKHSYQIYAVALDNNGSYADARKFLASFRLLSEERLPARNLHRDSDHVLSN